MAELLIGCGNDRRKKIHFAGIPDTFSGELTTLDWEESCKPDVLWDLNNLPLPFDDDMFDEIHAYEVLEHVGKQGDFRFFFNQFEEFWRILKPGGYFCGTCPLWDSPWSWGDPGHTRIISAESLVFLDQSEYQRQIDEGRPMTDYRFCYQGDFEPMAKHDLEHTWGFVLRARK